MADRLVVLSGGHIEQVGPPLEIYRRPRTLFAAGFLGSPRMNFLRGKIADRLPEGVAVELEGGGSVRASVVSEGAAVGEPVTVGFRPEHVQLTVVSDGAEGEGAAAPDKSGPLVNRVALIEDLGDHAIVHLDREGVAGPILVRVERKSPGGATSPREGQRVRFAVPPVECHVFDRDGKALPRRETAEPAAG